MPDLQPTEEQISELMRARPVAPVYLDNLLKFREQAIYAKGTSEAEFCLSGIEAFGKFMERFRIVVDELRGDLIFTEKAQRFVIRDGDWDRVAIIYLPARRLFLVMQQMPEFQAVKRYSDAGLLRQHLIEAAASARPLRQ